MVDIIIVVKNALPFLKRCIHSIQKNTSYPYQLIIVDNDSNEETKEFIRTIDAKIIFNNRNYGFGYANNQGIDVGTSKYICMLNSDTIVTKSWLENFIEVLEKNQFGMIGPSSNFVSSETQISNFDYFHDLDSDDYFHIEKHAKKLSRVVVETSRLIGFCLFTKREFLDTVGKFDERYEIGNFEDDDLSLRFIERGYKIGVAKGIFIYHYGGKSFKDEFRQEAKEILNTNRVLYENKWYHSKRITEIHSGKKSLKIGYLLASDTPAGGVKIVFEHCDRLKARGHDITIFCAIKETNCSWFPVKTKVVYGSLSNLPELDIVIGTYFSTLPFLAKNSSQVKIHLCQGYEGLLHGDPAILKTIQDSYFSVPDKICVSKWLKEIVDKEYNINSQYIANGLDLYDYSFKRHERNRIPRVLVSGTEKLDIKGVKKLLNILRTVKNIQIIRMSQFEDENTKEFEFYDMSKMSQKQIAEVYESCDFCISASDKVEGFSLPSIEAMASGTAVISTDNGGINDYAVNGQNSLIVEIGRIKWALDRLTTDKKLYDKLVDNGIKTARTYLWHDQIDKLEKYFYDKLKEKNKELGISVCMIVKDEEAYLEKCLESIKEITSEIIIVDTGSIDNTVSIAKKFGAKIFHYEWNDDFAAARNFSISKATGKWIFIIDADEVISKKDVEKFQGLLNDYSRTYIFRTRNYVKDSIIENVNRNKNESEDEAGYGWVESAKLRLFPNNKNIKFTGDVHEMVEESARQAKLVFAESNISIHHYGHIRQDKDKGKIYAKLGEKKLKSKKDFKSIYELALQYMTLCNYDESLILWRRALKLQPKNPGVIARIGTNYNLLEKYDVAEKYFLESLAIEETEYGYKHLAICYAKMDNYEKAYEAYKKIAYETENLRTKAEFAFCCNKLHKWDESIEILEKCLSLDRNLTISWGLIEIAYNEKGIELVQKNRLKQGYLLFKTATEINPKFENARKNFIELTRVLKEKRLF